MNEYQRGLNQRKNYFRDIDEKVPSPILEADEKDEDNELYGMPQEEPVVAHE